MTLLFRFTSCSLRGGGGGADSTPPTQPISSVFEEEGSEEEEEDEEGIYNEGLDDFQPYNPISTAFISPGFEERDGEDGGGEGKNVGPRKRRRRRQTQQNQSPILEIVLTALRKSLVTCSVEREDVASYMDIRWPTDVRHVSHVTFDRFNGFHGLPVELEPEVPRRVPSASVSVFGVSPQSMQCSIDERGNSVPTILLLMQRNLYAEGGLEAEGIFRINAENSQEVCVRSQLNEGLVPRGIDVHCLAGLIKAWFRELPRGVLDSLTPEQVMHCNTDDQCARLVKQLPPTESALLNWAINLMADVVENEHHNKMNARNIAMVFAPNMTQMADPLTALIHSVQVMNLLKTLITKRLQEREEQILASAQTGSNLYMASNKTNPDTSMTPQNEDKTDPEWAMDNGSCGSKPTSSNSLFRTATLDRVEFNSKMRRNWRSNRRGRCYDEVGELYGSFSGGSSPIMAAEETSCDGGCRYVNNDSSCSSGGREGGEGILERLKLRRGAKKKVPYGHPVFQWSKAVKMGGFGVVNT